MSQSVSESSTQPALLHRSRLVVRKRVPAKYELRLNRRARGLLPARQYFRYPVSKPDRTFIKIADMGFYFEVVVPFDYPYGKDLRGRAELFCAPDQHLRPEFRNRMPDDHQVKCSGLDFVHCS